jgi:hypothetical protein
MCHPVGAYGSWRVKGRQVAPQFGDREKSIGMMPTYIYRSVFEKPGIDMEYLGPVTVISRHRIRAVAIPVDHGQLHKVRVAGGLAGLLFTLLAPSPAWAASVSEQWKATSATAISITGDITISADRITFANGASLPLATAGRVSGFKVDEAKAVIATLFRVAAPDDPVLLSGNRLCGVRSPRPVTFLAVWAPARLKGGVDLRTIAVFSGSEQPTGAGNSGFCGTYSYEPGGTPVIHAEPAAAKGGIRCPSIFRGKSFMQVTVYEGPPSLQVALKPLQDDAAEDSNRKQPVSGWDRWKLIPRTNNRHYTLVCHYNSAPHQLWSRQAPATNADVEIELPAEVSECFQRRRADATSLGITCK